MESRESRVTLNECDAKLVLLGNSGVGKTSLAIRYVQGIYQADQGSTIGASFLTKRMFLDDWKVKLQIWDTAGQERFKSMTPMYYRGSNAALLVYDITQADSFQKMKEWVRELNINIAEPIIIAIAGNKCDLEAERQIPFATAKEYADSIDAILSETSAKQDKGIEDLFFQIAKRLVAKNSKDSNSQTTYAINIAQRERIKKMNSGSSGACCNP